MNSIRARVLALLLAMLAGEGPNRLMVVGDGGQRIYAAKQSLNVSHVAS